MIDKFCILTGMPKKKSKRQYANAATDDVDDNDEDIDNLLAEVTAVDLKLLADVRASSSTTTNFASSSSSSGGVPGESLQKLHVSELAIFGACKRGDIDQLRRWGRQGVRVKDADFLVDAICAEVSLDILRCLVKELGADINGARLTDGATPLCVAAEIGNLALLQFILKELGADVNQAENDGSTPLFIAAQRGYLAVVRLLVAELGADVNQAVHGGATPVYIAAQNGHLAVVQCLAKELGADVNQAANNGATPLSIAAQNGHLYVVRTLVKELEADINKARQDGVTPLMAAANNEHGEVVTFLIKYGANVQVAAPSFGTAAEISRRAGAPAQQTQFLEDRSHCARLGCDGEGKKKCAGCLKVYYCTRECQLTHWPAHKAECRQSVDKAASKET
jgi:ankyrin repeat protein